MNNTVRRYSRTLSDAFPDERAPAMWSHNGQPVQILTAPTWWQKFVRWFKR